MERAGGGREAENMQLQRQYPLGKRIDFSFKGGGFDPLWTLLFIALIL